MPYDLILLFRFPQRFLILTDFMPATKLQQYHYHNKFPVISLSGSNSPDSWLLMHSVADAPTTTLQRLQALLTGTSKISILLNILYIIYDK
jgi:predicted AlkP superfamily pyrophosphatase or phosphodiesterase